MVPIVNELESSTLAGQSHGNVGKILQGSLLPSIGNQPLPSLAVSISRREHVISGCAAVTGEMEEAGGTVVGDAAPVVNLEAPKAAGHALFIGWSLALGLCFTSDEGGARVG